MKGSKCGDAMAHHHRVKQLAGARRMDGINVDGT